MKKVVFVCDKCGKIIQRDPISIVPVILKEDGNMPSQSQPNKYSKLSEMQFCSECADKFVEFLTGDAVKEADSVSQNIDTGNHESVASHFPGLDALMEKYAEKINGCSVRNKAEEPALPVSGKDEKRKAELISRLSECVVEMEEEEIAEVARTYIEEGFSAFDGIYEGLLDGMNKASALFDAEEYFVTDILLCSDAMYAGLDVLRPYLPITSINEKGYKVVIGVVEGDTHDIGKNLVKIMLETAGFEVIDLGRDVPLDHFVDKAMETGASIICMSTLMTTTMGGMKTVIDKLVEKGVRDRFKIMIGGSPISKKYADEIGADGYTANAVEAVKLAKKFVGMKETDVVLGM